MAFPTSPSDQQLYTNALGTTYKYVASSLKWIIHSQSVVGSTGATGAPGVTGVAGTKPAGQIFITAAGAWPSVTSGCSVASQELGTNKVNIWYLSYDPDAIQYAEATIVMPSDWNAGTVTATFHWHHPATTTNYGVVWGCQGRAYADNEALDQAMGTVQTVTDTGGTTSNHYVSSATSGITLAGTPAAGQLVQFRIYRVATDGSDTLAVNAYLEGVLISYTRV